MIEAGLVFSGSAAVFFHLPKGRTMGSLPDSRTLWDVLWENRKDPFLGFAHTHPGSGVPAPSCTDITTFAAVEAGLGRRVIWLIASSDYVVRVDWEGPGKHDYKTFLVEEPCWTERLRDYSTRDLYTQEDGNG